MDIRDTRKRPGETMKWTKGTEERDNKMDIRDKR